MNIEQRSDLLNWDAEPVPARLASSVVCVRPQRERFEVLFAKRPENLTFAGGQYVFPGGKVDPEDYHVPLQWPGDQRERLAIPGLETGAAGAVCAAAIREIQEEVGLDLTPDVLHLWNNWVTPKPVPMRFDTYFFVATVPAEVEIICEPGEVECAEWLHPADAIARCNAGDFPLMFPTYKNVEQLAPLETLEQLLGFVNEFPKDPIEPQVNKDSDGFVGMQMPSFWPDPRASQEPSSR